MAESAQKDGRGPPRYRALVGDSGLIAARVREGESDLWVLSSREIDGEVQRALGRHRRELEGYLRRDPEFASSLLPRGAREDAPRVARIMSAAAARCGVGPMAAVAGALAQLAGEAALRHSPEVIVENGGDLFLRIRRERVVALYAGRRHPLTGKVGILARPGRKPQGIATSSGTIGPSRSWGRADAAVVLAEDAALADAAATALGNRICSDANEVWERAREFLRRTPGVRGGMVVLGERVFLHGEIDLVEVKSSRRRWEMEPPVQALATIVDPDLQSG